MNSMGSGMIYLLPSFKAVLSYMSYCVVLYCTVFAFFSVLRKYPF